MKNVKNEKDAAYPGRAKAGAVQEPAGEAFVRLVETVFRFIHAYYPEFNDALARHRVNYSQYAALLTVYMYGSLTEGELARLIHVNPSTMSRMLYALERAGWLKSERDAGDRRKVVVSLSPRGRKQVEEMIGSAAEVMRRLTERLPAREKEGVYRVVDLIESTLRRLIEVAG